MYRCAFLGCGGRARGHAQAYQLVKRGKMVAICDKDQGRLHAFGNDFNIEKRYTDLHEMLDAEQPDLLHLVTQPDLRVPLMTIAAEHQVPAAIVEKPIALQGEDFRALRELEKQSRTKFVVNHQLHFHPNFQMLYTDVTKGHIGKPRLIEASARLNLSGQGTHVLELMFTLNGQARPMSVFAQVAGTEGLKGSHPAPDQSIAVITFENGVRGLVTFGTNAPMTNEGANHFHKRVAAYGNHGFVEWRMVGWERLTANGYEQGQHDYGEQDIQGQAALTEAVFDWLENANAPHPTRLNLSLTQFNVVLGIYTSVLRGVPVELPLEPEDGLIEALKAKL